MTDMLEHQEMRVNFNDASSDTEMRDACLQDLERFYIDGAWWSGSHGEQFKNKPKPEFNKLWRSINRVVGDINDMELQAIIISNSDDATDEGAELLQKRWRNDFTMSEGAEASEVATMEATVGGFGCTKLVSRYEDEEQPDPNKQYLSLEIIHSACTSVYFDAGAIKKDKSDSRYGWHLIRTNRDKIEEEYGVDVVSFMSPTTYPWAESIDMDSQRDIYLAHYYEVIDKTVTDHDFSLIGAPTITSGDGITDPFGNKYTREDLKDMKDMYEEMIGEPVPTTRRKVKYVEYALADGEKYLTKPQRMPFKRVPLFPRYGYFANINGQDYYCGEVRKQSDQEMFNNYFASSLMEIMAAPQVEKPEYLPEQIARHASQRSRADIDNVPFLMSDAVKDAQGNIVQAGPIGYQKPPSIGTGLASAGQFLQQSMNEMGGMGQATVPANTSGEAIQQANQRQDDTFLPIVKNVLHSIKAQCEAWIPSAQELYFNVPRKLRIVESDGETFSQVATMEMVQLPTGEYGPYGNTAPGKYAVRVKQGEAYRDAREAERQATLDMLNYVGSDTEFGQLLAMQAMTLTNGEGVDNMRQVAKYKMIDQMIAMQMPYEPENEQEAQYMQMKMQQIQQQMQAAQAQQQQLMQQTAMAEGQARMMEGQAALQNEQNDYISNQIKMYEAETKRYELQLKAQKVGADIQIDQSKLQLDAMKQMRN